MTLSQPDFNYIRRLVLDQSAIVLEEDKGYLVESRLLPLARQEGFASLGLLVRRMQAEPFHGLHRRAVEAMTTNETSFFRDFHPFEALRKSVLPQLMARRAAASELAVWCAACSSGQEPYSLAILIRENFPQLASWKIRILATDLSSEILARAREGRFSQLEVNRGLPASLLVRYFQKRGCDWYLRDDIRGMVDFQIVNLAGTWPFLLPVDIVMIRNVLIYFGVETKKQILGKIRRVLKPDGYLFLGAAETTFSIDDSYDRVQLERATCYRIRAA
ncbi:MAG TPA: protein-glutamate O-methyltransferase CheR [Terriglobia bacterium]|nr:protein-glutamate O-methyltransferase CheR [Terriglobia bacterium]